jgi:hypothetical protein
MRQQLHLNILGEGAPTAVDVRLLLRDKADHRAWRGFDHDFLTTTGTTSKPTTSRTIFEFPFDPHDFLKTIRFPNEANHFSFPVRHLPGLHCPQCADRIDGF